MAAPAEGDAGGPGLDIFEQILYDVLIHAEWSKSSERKEVSRQPKSRVSVSGKFWSATLRKFMLMKPVRKCISYGTAYSTEQVI